HPESALSCLNLVSVFRKLERSGDHITNIAEEIVFFIDAKVLKHSGRTDEHYLNDKK
ncbi:MAG: phosphate transport system regulatory protein PhoU, partial [Bacteroides sp.]|nr:phosphate transport system regulatory protein PhoU [Bacteroides sp.]